VSWRRRTIADRVSVSGVGLHLGQACTLTFAPAAPGAGIGFVRVDQPDRPRIPAHVSVAQEAERRTQLGQGTAALHTVEHVLAAVAGLQIDDLDIEMTGPEPPIMDGSAGPFVTALQQCGVVLQDGAPVPLVITEPFRHVEGESEYEALPGQGLTIEVGITFAHPTIGTQSGTWTVTPETFEAELSTARTFGFVHEVEALRAKGLIQGASTDNAVVLDAAGVVAGTSLRWPDEFVRHKGLDLVGDLALVGGRIRGRIRAVRPSHAGTVRFVRALVHRFAPEKKRMMGIEEIMKVLPHRYPFLLVDKVIEIEEGKRIVGIKNVTINEPFFQGHFPGHPIMPGVLIIEGMAQVGGMLLMGTVDDPESKVVYFMSLDNVKFRRPVKPGDQLRCELELVQVRGMVCKMRGVATVDGTVVALFNYK